MLLISFNFASWRLFFVCIWKTFASFYASLSLSIDKDDNGTHFHVSCILSQCARQHRQMYWDTVFVMLEHFYTVEKFTFSLEKWDREKIKQAHIYTKTATWIFDVCQQVDVMPADFFFFFYFFSFTALFLCRCLRFTWSCCS